MGYAVMTRLCHLLIFAFTVVGATGVFANTFIPGTTVGNSSATPGYQSIICGGSVVSASSPCPIAISEPSTTPFSLTANGAFGQVQATLFGYAEADIDLQVVGSGGSIAPQESEDQTTWHVVNCYRTVGGPPGLVVSSFGYVTQVACPISMSYFRWNLTSYSSGTYSGYTSYRTHLVGSNAITSFSNASFASGCQFFYHLSGGSAASSNSTLISSGSHTVCDLVIVNTSATNAWLKIYNGGSAPTCSSATGLYMDIPILAGQSLRVAQGVGAYFNNGVGFCITGGGTDTDSSSAPTGIYINANYQ